MATTNLTNSNFWTEMFKTIITAISDTDSVTVKTADGTDSALSLPNCLGLSPKRDNTNYRHRRLLVYRRCTRQGR